MKNDEFIHKLRKLTRQAENDGDSILVVHVSASEGKMKGYEQNFSDDMFWCAVKGLCVHAESLSASGGEDA